LIADWDCIVRKLRAGGDGRDKPGHDGERREIGHDGERRETGLDGERRETGRGGDRQAMAVRGRD
jgi:hypothetical protein